MRRDERRRQEPVQEERRGDARQAMADAKADLEKAKADYKATK
jgi:hypothetical protein